MRKTKYITSGGLAFAEAKDMEKLRKYSMKGWHVSSFKFMGYRLEKGESTDYIYSVDYRSLKKDETEEYFDFFAASGWAHVDSEADMHLFRAYPHTKPIYSDSETLSEKHGSLITSMQHFAIPLIAITVLAWIGVMLSSGALESVLIMVAVMLSVISLPTAWTLVTSYSNKWKVEGRIRLVNLVKTIPFLLLLLSIVMIIFIGNTASTVKFIAYMLLGAIALPTSIWLIMSLYHKIVGKQAANKS